MNNNTELQKLLTRVAENRIRSGNYDKEMMETNLKVLVADMSITGEQYDYLIKLMYPDIDKLEENTNTVNTDTNNINEEEIKVEVVAE